MGGVIQELARFVRRDLIASAEIGSLDLTSASERVR